MTNIREIIWPEDFSELQRIEEQLICGICYSFIDTAVMTPCSHNYCSICIRKYLHYKTQCPACFQATFEKDLYINRTLDTIVRYFTKIREKLISCIESKSNTRISPKHEVPCSPPVRPARSPRDVDEKQCSTGSPSTVQRSIVLKNEASSSNANLTPKKLTGIAKLFGTPRSKKEVTAQLPVSTKSVLCPVCNVDIPDTHINRHLDDCLKRSSGKEPVKTSPKRQPLPKLVLHVMKDAQLRKKMKELGLSTQGDRKAMEVRFLRYSTIYNAECDKLEPRPVSELIKQCEQEENLERKIHRYMTTNTITNRLQIERNAKEETIEEAHRKYREVNQSSFDKLIEEVRKRHKVKTKESGNVSNEESNASKQSEIENTPNKYFLNQTSLDSDSDSTLCPLQYYSGDDPLKFVSTNYSESSNSCTSISKNSETESIAKNSKTESIAKNSDTESISKNSNTEIQKTDEWVSNPVKSSDVDGSDCYNLTTDPESSETDDVPDSPPKQKDSNNKRVRLSDLFAGINSSACTSFSIDANEVTTYQAEREAIARGTCDSIIKDFTFNDSSDSSGNEFIEKLIKEIPKDQTLNLETISCESSCDSILNKENDSSSANGGYSENLTESAMCRPVRKRNCPSRYGSEEHLKIFSDHINPAGTSQNDPHISALADGTLKRRRGRSKAKTLDRSFDESQNPPKRPVRRRQVNSDRNLS